MPMQCWSKAKASAHLCFLSALEIHAGIRTDGEMSLSWHLIEVEAELAGVLCFMQ